MCNIDAIYEAIKKDINNHQSLLLNGISISDREFLLKKLNQDKYRIRKPSNNIPQNPKYSNFINLLIDKNGLEYIKKNIEKLNSMISDNNVYLFFLNKKYINDPTIITIYEKINFKIYNFYDKKIEKKNTKEYKKYKIIKYIYIIFTFIIIISLLFGFNREIIYIIISWIIVFLLFILLIYTHWNSIIRKKLLFIKIVFFVDVLIIFFDNILPLRKYIYDILSKIF